MQRPPTSYDSSMSVTYQDIRAAATRLAGQAVRTPLIENLALNERVGGRVLIKPEILQRVGAFKFRGAYNRLVQLSADERRRGVVAFSSGNHAQGVALAARLLDIPAVIVMPADAPAVKVAATRDYGAEVRFYDRATEDREAISAQIATTRGATIVPAFDDPAIIAGQGTVGLELVENALQIAGRLDAVICPVGGGGLLAGSALAIHNFAPDAQIWGVEPILFDDTRRSLAAGERVGASPAQRSLCDALESPMPGKITFPILKRLLAGIATVSDAEVAEAMRYAFATLKLVVEPGGVVALAALLAGKIEPRGLTIGIVLSGGNVDPELFAQVIRGEI